MRNENNSRKTAFITETQPGWLSVVPWGISCVHAVVLWGRGPVLHAPGVLCLLEHLARLSGTYLPAHWGSWVLSRPISAMGHSQPLLFPFSLGSQTS